ncbi:MAG: Uma2 family endonuclease [Polyangiaceae bacterium]|nr:Uma2 family endonuclease [Polyangiaceae bacterium]
MIIETGGEGGRRGSGGPGAGGRSGVDRSPAWSCPGVGTEPRGEGPFHADQIRPGEPYELSDGRVVHCLPTGGTGSGPNQLGASVVGWDPAVQQVGVDTGYTPRPGVLRAPDVAVGNVPSAPGWVPGAPDLAIEYADVGQDEDALSRKICDLLEGGAKLVWVVRLMGARRVEVHRRGEPVQVAIPGERLSAPGILRNPVLVESLYDRGHAEQATLTNLLQRRGYASLEAVRSEEARVALRRVLARRGLALSHAEEARIDACADRSMLEQWIGEAAVAATAADALH